MPVPNPGPRTEPQPQLLAALQPASHYREQERQNTHPCECCPIRKFYARVFDMHFYGADCFYECGDYKKWKESHPT